MGSYDDSRAPRRKREHAQSAGAATSAACRVRFPHVIGSVLVAQAKLPQNHRPTITMILAFWLAIIVPDCRRVWLL
ncbi:hypothetical protein ACFXPS_17775 [Nocardia sp. NPDC059091]|uniref:hypothetical protein n=1 Tax=Nocardia sp. NPDC059091 TaxID=3346724 RepID=UPI0036C0F05E